MGSAVAKQLSPHLWMIMGVDKSRFPSGNALFLKIKSYNVLIDTNPGDQLVSEFLKSEFNLKIEDITDIVLSHAHLDHSRGLSSIFNQSNAQIHAHSDTLKRCEKKARVGLYAGIPKEKITHFENFGASLGFEDQEYPNKLTHSIENEERLEFENVTIIAHETNAHCLHMLDYEIIDEGKRFILSCDYDFTPVPWYGVPQRGVSVEVFKQTTRDLVNRSPDIIISSHRTEPLNKNDQIIELEKYTSIIDARTKNIIELIMSKNDIFLKDIRDFVYPVSKMNGKYSKDYIECARTWDYWISLAHLEDGWRKGYIKCIEPDGDQFLEACVKEGEYLPEIVSDYLIKGWAEETLNGNAPFSLPLNSRWARKLE